jgi:ParB family chromosome partitioning protein
MAKPDGYIMLERSIDTITVGVRQRSHDGDLEALMESIQRFGLIQPPTIAPDGILICGKRRLEAIKRLGWRTVRVWVRSGISDSLSRLLAERDENALHEPLPPLDACRLYRELKHVLAEQAALRQAATRFGADNSSAPNDGGADSAPPSLGDGKTREQAASLVGRSHFMLDQISALEHIAADNSNPDSIRQLAQHELGTINAGGAIDPSYRRVKQAIDVHNTRGLGRQAEPIDDHLQRRARTTGAHRSSSGKPNDQETGPPRWSPRAFLFTWQELLGWTTRCDAAEIATGLTTDQLAMFDRVVAETVAFAQAIHRAQPATQPHAA